MSTTSIFGGGVPLLRGHGAGSEVRKATGVTVFCGMVGVTLLGLFLTPVFYVGVRRWEAGYGPRSQGGAQSAR